MIATCAHCGGGTRLTDGREVYPHRRDLWNKPIYVCDRCDARVGCHPDSIVPLGTAANAELRDYRMHLHGIIDPLWKDARDVSRSKARKMVYAYMRYAMDIGPQSCHVGEFDVARTRLGVSVMEGVDFEHIMQWWEQTHAGVR